MRTKIVSIVVTAAGALGRFAPRANLTVEPHPQFGYACRIVRPA